MNTTKTTTRKHRMHNYRISNKMKGNTPVFYHLSTGDIIEGHSGNKDSSPKFKLLQNKTDSLNAHVVIEFYLPEPVMTRLILMDSDLTDALYLINKELEAGRHIFKSRIRNEELLRFKYYYKLDAYGYNEVKKMEYVH